MATDLIERNSGDLIATRFYGGDYRGVVIQFHFPVNSWEDVKNAKTENGQTVSEWIQSQDRIDTVYFAGSIEETYERLAQPVVVAEAK